MRHPPHLLHLLRRLPHRPPPHLKINKYLIYTHKKEKSFKLQKSLYLEFIPNFIQGLSNFKTKIVSKYLKAVSKNFFSCTNLHLRLSLLRLQFHPPRHPPLLLHLLLLLRPQFPHLRHLPQLLHLHSPPSSVFWAPHFSPTEKIIDYQFMNIVGC